MAIPRRNAVVIVGDRGLDHLLTHIYDHWERGEEYALVWHVAEGHDPNAITQPGALQNPQELPPDDACPRIIFALREIA